MASNGPPSGGTRSHLVAYAFLAGAWHVSMAALFVGLPVLVVALLDRQGHPALVLWAAHDLFLPVSWAVKLARDIPGAPDDPKLLPFAGHFWQAEVPREGARVIREFFDGVVAGGPSTSGQRIGEQA